jgi:hypothetical protein
VRCYRLAVGSRHVHVSQRYMCYICKDPFVHKWFDFLAFALSGCDAAHTQAQAAVIAYRMSDWYRPGAVLDFPMGGVHSRWSRKSR